jgi:DNA mismatch repair protein MutH
VELKVIPLIQLQKKVVVKERTKVCSIHYPSLVKEQWETSHAKRKLNKILFVYYLYDKENLANSLIKRVELWELAKDKSEIIIQDDWQKTKQKVVDGYAHKLSEKGFKILSPARSGSGGVNKNGEQKDLVFQPNKAYRDKALKRAFTLKQSFTNQLWKELNAVKYESILELLDISSMDRFEHKILHMLHKFAGKSIIELSNIFDIKIPNGKNQVATIVKKAIGFKNVNAKIKEFEQLGITIKTIKVRPKDNMPIEAVSFPTMKLQAFEEESFVESELKYHLEKN